MESSRAKPKVFCCQMQTSCSIWIESRWTWNSHSKYHLVSLCSGVFSLWTPPVSEIVPQLLTVVWGQCSTYERRTPQSGSLWCHPTGTYSSRSLFEQTHRTVHSTPTEVPKETHSIPSWTYSCAPHCFCDAAQIIRRCFFTKRNPAPKNTARAAQERIKFTQKSK